MLMFHSYMSMGTEKFIQSMLLNDRERHSHGFILAKSRWSQIVDRGISSRIQNNLLLFSEILQIYIW